MRIIDTHTHLDEKIPGDAAAAAAVLNSQLESSAVERAIVLHLEIQRWSLEDFGAAMARFDRLVGFACIHPDAPDARVRLKDAVEVHGFQGLKLHPRFQNCAPNSENTVALVRYAGEIGVPVLIDAFPDGDWLMAGRNILEYADLCKRAPGTRVIVAHMGGHHVIDVLMVCKRIPNMYLDTSYSVLYYKGSGVERDLTYAMRSLRFNKIMYGSDYPDRTIADTISGTVQIFENAGMSADEIDKIMYQNAAEFFQWKVA